jgi:hypothetical protein
MAGWPDAYAYCATEAIDQGSSLATPLQRLVTQHIGWRGRTFTLSDKNYRGLSTYMTFELVLNSAEALLWGLISDPSVCVCLISRERDYWLFVGRYMTDYLTAVQAIWSGGQAANVKCANHIWPAIVDLLLNSSDVVIMDISKIGRGSAWEIETLRNRGLAGSCLFICSAAERAAAHAELRRLFGDGSVPAVHHYTEPGHFLNNGNFNRAFHAAMLTSSHY